MPTSADSRGASDASPQTVKNEYAGPTFPWWCQAPWLHILIVGGVTVGRILAWLLFGI